MREYRSRLDARFRQVTEFLADFQRVGQSRKVSICDSHHLPLPELSDKVLFSFSTRGLAEPILNFLIHVLPLSPLQNMGTLGEAVEIFGVTRKDLLAQVAVSKQVGKARQVRPARGKSSKERNPVSG